MVRRKARIRFAKQGDLRLIGHRDLMRCFERLFRRTELPLAMSKGYHPKIRVSFPLPLAVGLEGLDEVMEVELEASEDARFFNAESLRTLLGEDAPEGLSFRKLDFLPEGAKKVRIQSATYLVTIPDALNEGLPSQIEELLERDTLLVERGEGKKPLDIRPPIRRLELMGSILTLEIAIAQGGTNPGPSEVLAAIGLNELFAHGGGIVRSKVAIE